MPILLRLSGGLLLLSSVSLARCAQAQTDSATDAATRALVTSISEQAGLHTPFRPSFQYESDGYQTISGNLQQPLETHLKMSQTGTTLSTGTGAAKRTITYLGFTGSVIDGIHSTHKPSTRTALLSKLLYSPALELLIFDHDPSYVVSLAGPGQLGGRAVLILNVASTWLSDNPDAGMTKPMLKLYVDPASFHILQRDDTIYDTKNTAYARSIAYEDYRPAGSFVAPFKLVESMGDQILNTTQWNSISLSF